MVQCASTFRVTDYLGGCNGARIRWRGIIIVKLHDFNFNCLTPTLCRHSPGRDWAVNTGLDSALALLEPVKQEFGSPLSWADLIVLAGTTALESSMDQVTSTSFIMDIVCVIIVTMDQVSIPFCGGRVDEEDEAVAAEAWKRLEPRIT